MAMTRTGSRRVFAAAFGTLLAASAASAQQDAAWPRSTLEQEGMTPAPLAALVERGKTGGFGNLDRLVVVRNGKLLLSERFARDYREISRGKKTAIGCGIDMCTDSLARDPFNYLHPDWHPWYQGRQLHTLQSVTKSVTATLIGIAIGRGEIKSMSEPLLSFFPGYDLSKVDPRLRKSEERSVGKECR